ncbi:hypothetical protein [Staphylococcus aureus]
MRNYLGGKCDEDGYENGHMKGRLYGELGDCDYICLYGMKKGGNESYNW